MKPGNRTGILFLLLILAHVLHATEEYSGRLWEVYTPAIYVCNLVSRNPERGFLIINIVFVLLSLLYWTVSVRKKPSGLVWLWVILQSINVTGHFSWSLYRMSYTPGVISSFIILVLVILLAKELSRQGS